MTARAAYGKRGHGVFGRAPRMAARATAPKAWLMAVAMLCVALAGACVLPCLCNTAFALPSDQDGIDTNIPGGVALSDRYQSLKDLSESLTDEEGVVIATRIGVLVSTNRALNNSDVSFSGEAVGDILNAGEGSKWVNLRGSSNSVISVYLSDEQAGVVRYVGDYHTTGSTLRVTGTYHIACPEHQGELDVHATSIEVVDGGGPVIHTVNAGRLGLAFVLCGIAAIVLAAYIWVRWYLRKRDSDDQL